MKIDLEIFEISFLEEKMAGKGYLRCLRP